jgi:hypothetical protein
LHHAVLLPIAGAASQSLLDPAYVTILPPRIEVLQVTYSLAYLT